jgi:hypothetical protein
MRDILKSEFESKVDALTEYAMRVQSKNRKRFDIPFVNSIGKGIAIWCREQQRFIGITCIPSDDTDELFIRVVL